MAARLLQRAAAACGGRRAALDLAALLAACAAVTLLAVRYQGLERVVGWSARFEAWQIDEALILAVTLSLAASLFAVRRIRELRQEMALRLSSEERLRDIAESASDWWWETDADCRLTYLSERIRAIHPHYPEPLLGRTFWEAWPEQQGDASALRAILHDRRPFREFRFTALVDGSNLRHFRLSGTPVHDADRRFRGYRGTGSDITGEVEAEQRAWYLAFHDPLTALANRAQLKERMERTVTAVRRGGGLAAALYIDLDRFKEVNDTLGHTVGDALLRQAAQRLSEATRSDDTVARLGGDEFVIVLARVEDEQQVEALCRRLLTTLSQPFVVDGHEIHVGASIGAALTTAAGPESGDLLRGADIALRQAKVDGRGCYRLFAPCMEAQVRLRRQIEDELRGAQARGEFGLAYQPVFRAEDGALTGVEALARWHHPERGDIAPSVFIPLAEDTGIIIGLGAWVLREACGRAAGWPGLSIAVNVSSVQLRHSSFVELVGAILRDTGIDPGRVELEVTESVLMQYDGAVLVALQQLKALGVRIAIDDFGTGYSSLSYLQQYPFDTLKVDRVFVNDLGRTTRSGRIIDAMVALGHSLGMRVHAEGVETAEQQVLLTRAGCDYLQGYRLGRPGPAEAIDALLRAPPLLAPPAVALPVD